MRIETWQGAVVFCLVIVLFALVVGHALSWVYLPRDQFWQVFHLHNLIVLVIAPPVALWGGFQIKKGTAAMDRLRYLADHDDMTGLLNRRCFLQSLTERDMREGQLVTLDIDHFKRINDKFGHSAGDQVIVAVAQCLQKSVRGRDIVARFGGEEFILFLVGMTKAQALVRAEELRQGIAGQPMLKDAGIAVTVSIGLSALGPDDDIEQSLRESDQALYAAKSAGRNRVRHFEMVGVANEFALRAASL